MQFTDSQIIACLLLILFGVVYNWFIEKQDDWLPLSIQVAIGEAFIVLAVVIFVDWQTGLILLAFQAAAGGPMILGNLARDQERKRQAREQANAEAERKAAEIESAGRSNG